MHWDFIGINILEEVTESVPLHAWLQLNTHSIFCVIILKKLGVVFT